MERNLKPKFQVGDYLCLNKLADSTIYKVEFINYIDNKISLKIVFPGNFKNEGYFSLNSNNLLKAVILDKSTAELLYGP